MSEFVEQCRREWRRLGVADPLAEEMAADLASDLEEAEAEGVSAAEYLGSSASDPRSFAASWASERGIIPAPPDPEKGRRRPLALVAFTALAAITVIVAALLLATGEPKVALTTTRTTVPHLPLPPGRPTVPAGTVHRVQASAAAPVEWILLVRRDRRARLLCVAVVALGPLATTAPRAWPPSPGVISVSNHRRRQQPVRPMDADRQFSARSTCSLCPLPRRNRAGAHGPKPPASRTEISGSVATRRRSFRSITGSRCSAAAVTAAGRTTPVTTCTHSTTRPANGRRRRGHPPRRRARSSLPPSP